LPPAVKKLCAGIKADEPQKKLAAMLSDSGSGLIILGHIAGRHPAYAAIRALAAALSELSGASFGTLSEGPNAAGACMAGVLPHRGPGGRARDESGLHAVQILDADLDAILMLAVEPDKDLADQDAVAKLADQSFVAALTHYDSEALRTSADLLLPIGSYAESAGTYVNCEGRWQSFAGFARPVGEARPAWKVLRVLGNLLNVDGFDYETSEAVRDELQAMLGEIVPHNTYEGTSALSQLAGADDAAHVLDVPMYAIDGLVRRATALQLTPEARRSRVGGRDA
jgi:NADH-quinone oxidoreductase subunit G